MSIITIIQKLIGLLKAHSLTDPDAADMSQDVETILDACGQFIQSVIHFEAAKMTSPYSILHLHELESIVRSKQKYLSEKIKLLVRYCEQEGVEKVFKGNPDDFQDILLFAKRIAGEMIQGSTLRHKDSKKN